MSEFLLTKRPEEGAVTLCERFCYDKYWISHPVSDLLLPTLIGHRVDRASGRVMGISLRRIGDPRNDGRGSCGRFKDFLEKG